MAQQELSWSLEFRFGQVITSCKTALQCDQHVCLIDFFELLSGVSMPLPLGVRLPGRAEFESMLEVKAWESAALSFLTPDSALMISDGAKGAMATVILPRAAKEVTQTGATVTLALLAAIAQALRLEFAAK